MSSFHPLDPAAAPSIAAPSRAGRSRSGRMLATLGLVAASGVMSMTTAAAHVRVIPESTAASGYSVLNFRVPNEKENASTTTVRITLPTDHPFSSVSVRPLPGWKASTTMATLPTPITSHGSTITKAARTVTWTADGAAAIAPHQFQVFSMSVGPLPAAGTHLVLPAEQTYSDGDVVKWDQTMVGTTEPEKPAPEFTVTAAAAKAGPAAATAGPQPVAAAQEPVSSTGSSTSDSAARLLGAGGLAVGLGGLALGGLAFSRSRTSPSRQEQN